MSDKNWKQTAADAWNNPGWKEAAEQYHRDRAGRPLIVELDAERRKRLRNLLKGETSFSQVYYEINSRREGGAPQPTVEALIYSLRERGTKALEESATKRRLSEFSDQQVIDIGDRLQKLKPEIARAWSIEEVKLLLQARIK
jgi:superfamily I DNA and/or RNA helicase